MKEDFSLLSLKKSDLSDYMKEQAEKQLEMMLADHGQRVRKFIKDNQSLIRKVGDELL